MCQIIPLHLSQCIVYFAFLCHILCNLVISIQRSLLLPSILLSYEIRSHFLRKLSFRFTPLCHSFLCFSFSSLVTHSILITYPICVTLSITFFPCLTTYPYY